MQDTQSIPRSKNGKNCKVGIKNVNYPILFQDKDDKTSQPFPSSATFSFLSNCLRIKKGTHMSRFPSILYECGSHLNLKNWNKWQ